MDMSPEAANGLRTTVVSTVTNPNRDFAMLINNKFLEKEGECSAEQVGNVNHHG